MQSQHQSGPNLNMLPMSSLRPLYSAFCGRFPIQYRISTSSNNHRYSSYSKADGTERDQLYKTVEIEVKGHEPAVLNSYEAFVKMAAGNLEVDISKIWSPPKSIKRYTLLKSAHIYRKHMVQYEMRTHYRCFELKHLTGSTANTLLEYLQRNLPEGVAMKVTRHAIEALPDHLKSPPSAAATKTVK